MSDIKKVYINNETFMINCESGIQDVAWLAMSAAYLYGKNSIPPGKFIPIYAQNKNKEYLHPKMTILTYNSKIGEEVFVRVKENLLNPELELTESENKWIAQAYGKDKYNMEVKIKFTPSIHEFKYNIKTFFIRLKLIPHSLIAALEDKAAEIIEYALPQNELIPDIHEIKVVLPIGEIQVQKIYYQETPENIKEIGDLSKNKLIIDRFPEPLLNRDKELIIKKREQAIGNKEKELQGIIVKIEEEKQIEEERMRALQIFLESVPYTLDDIYEMTLKLIPNSESDLEPIFKLFYENEFKYFKLLYNMFESYSIYLNEEEEYGEYIDIHAIKHCLITYVNIERPNEYESIQNSFKYYFLDKKQSNPYFKFNEFMCSLIYTLYFNNNMNSIDLIPEHIKFMFLKYEQMCKLEYFKCLFTDQFVISQIKSSIVFLKRLYDEYAREAIFIHYNEMGLDSYSDLLKEIGKMDSDYSYVETRKIKYNRVINFITFLELICHIALTIKLGSDDNVNENENDNQHEEIKLENYEKVAYFITSIKKTFTAYLPTEEKIEETEEDAGVDIDPMENAEVSNRSMKFEFSSRLENEA